uniref:Uncharacterized protein n=1 Tax=Lotharella oceanica TaxID=641309 RepID=A0A7S2TQ16_9EUKA|mmetsp:Transcript_24680/g.46111  ORF Transcript_24680/g.46111 Transcript_24680/m.46111 type:complete len:304 (+) Transcript_24680:2-913(+)
MYHASNNPNGLHILNRECCGWTYGKFNAIEIYIDPPSSWVQKLGYAAEKKKDIMKIANTRSVESLEEEINMYRNEGLKCYRDWEHTKCLIQEAIGKIPRLNPEGLRDRLAESQRMAESAMHPALCLDQVNSIMKDLDETVKAYRRYGKELKEYKDQTITAHGITEKMRLVLLEHTQQIPRLSKEGLAAKLEEARQNAKKFLEPSLAVNQQKVLFSELYQAIKEYHEQGERLEMITTKYVLPVRFAVGDGVIVNVNGRWRKATVKKHWEMGYPYRVLLDNKKLTWVTEDIDLEIRKHDPMLETS